MNQRLPLWVPPALCFALLVNGLLFLLLPLLTQTRPLVHNATEPVAVNLVRARDKEPPPRDKEEIKPPEREETKILRSLQPDLVSPQILMPAMPSISSDINLDLLGNTDSGFSLIFNADEIDQPPRALAKMPPLYPYKAKRLEIEGYVKVKFLVDETGAVSQISILESSPKGLFEDSVFKVLPKWEFAPGSILGEPVSSWVVTTIRFELE